MNTTFAIICAASLVATGAFGQGAQVIIKQRAKELSNQNNVQQGVPPPSQPQPNASRQPTVATPLQAAIARLRVDLAAIKANPAPTPMQKQTLAQHLIDTAQGTKPSQQTASKLAQDLSTALAENPISATDRDRLLSDINAALNPQKYQPEQLSAIYGDAQAIFQVAGVKRTTAVMIADDIKAIAAETKR